MSDSGYTPPDYEKNWRASAVAIVNNLARDRVHESLCSCSEYPNRCVTYGSVDALHPSFDAESMVDDLFNSGWLVAHDAEVAAKAWDEGFNAGFDAELVRSAIRPGAPDLRVNPYRDQIGENK